MYGSNIAKWPCAHCRTHTDQWSKLTRTHHATPFLLFDTKRKNSQGSVTNLQEQYVPPRWLTLHDTWFQDRHYVRCAHASASQKAVYFQIHPTRGLFSIIIIINSTACLDIRIPYVFNVSHAFFYLWLCATKSAPSIFIDKFYTYIFFFPYVRENGIYANTETHTS